MSHRLTVRRRAELHLNKAVVWYEQQRLGLGIEFVSEVRAALDTIKDRPKSFPASYRNARRANVSRFPYAVFFIVRRDQIFITAILHTSRNPGPQKPDRL